MAVATRDKLVQRYLGDAATMVVHDLNHEDPTGSGCAIGALLESGNAVRFAPDRLSQGASEGYRNCPHCLYRHETRRGILQEVLYEPLGRDSADEAPETAGDERKRR